MYVFQDILHIPLAQLSERSDATLLFDHERAQRAWRREHTSQEEQRKRAIHGHMNMLKDHLFTVWHARAREISDAQGHKSKVEIAALEARLEEVTAAKAAISFESSAASVDAFYERYGYYF